MEKKEEHGRRMTDIDTTGKSQELTKVAFHFPITIRNTIFEVWEVQQILVDVNTNLKGKAIYLLKLFFYSQRSSHAVTSFLKTQGVHVLFSAGIDLLCTNG